MIYIDNRQDIINVNEELEELIKHMVEYALKEEEVSVDSEVSIIFVDNKEIKELNKDMRGIDRATDVLSFPMLEYRPHHVYKDDYLNFEFDETYLDEGILVLGDMALSLERAKEQSEEYGHSFEREVCYLVIHSILHLLGYDHIEEEDKPKMRKREEEILNKFNMGR